MCPFEHIVHSGIQLYIQYYVRMESETGVQKSFRCMTQIIHFVLFALSHLPLIISGQNAKAFVLFCA